jgi:hypothetical protein
MAIIMAIRSDGRWVCGFIPSQGGGGIKFSPLVVEVHRERWSNLRKIEIGVGSSELCSKPTGS